MSRQDIHTPERWAEILKKQADYTKEYRHNLYAKVDIQNKKEILDIGCGTGAVTGDIASLTEGHITGVDIDDKKLAYAKSLFSERVPVVRTDVLHLPFKDSTFDLVVFNIVLTHITQQQEAVCEMARVTKKEGIVLATMEPDYEGTLNYPENEATSVFNKFFEDIGVEMQTGRKLRYFFTKAGLKTDIGLFNVFDDFKTEDKSPEERVEEFLKNFTWTEKKLSEYGWDAKKIEEHKQKEIELIRDDLAFSFVPCFSAIGRK